VSMRRCVGKAGSGWWRASCICRRNGRRTPGG
jgi:hypothetical protein